MDLVYTQTLLYIVHVDEIELGTEGNEKQQQSNKVSRKISKRTTASFNEREEPMPISTPPSFSFFQSLSTFK